MKKKIVSVFIIGLAMALPANAQTWNKWDTRSTIDGVLVRFALIFPALPDNATEFDFIVPSSVWQFKHLKCK